MLKFQASDPRSSKNDLDTLLFEILSSIAAILVSTGYGFSRVNKLTKMAFVRAASSADHASESRTSIARIAALTGLTRTDVSAMIRTRNTNPPVPGGSTSRVARVASGWITDKKFTRKAAGPRHLEFAGPGNSFTALVRRYSGDIPPKALLTEMIRLGIARRSKSGKLVLIRSDVVQSRRTSDALKAAIPLVSFLARANAAQRDSELTARSDKIELKFSSVPQVFAAMRELHDRHRAFVAALKELGGGGDNTDQYAINVSVAIAATNPRISSPRRTLKANNRRARTRK
jgi:hypothetical protein